MGSFLDRWDFVLFKKRLFDISNFYPPQETEVTETTDTYSVIHKFRVLAARWRRSFEISRIWFWKKRNLRGSEM